MTKIDFYCSLLLLISSLYITHAQETTLSLWGEKVPNQRNSREEETIRKNDITLLSNVQNPEIQVFLPSKRNATGEAVLIFPGGGYHVLAYDWEGSDVAKWLNSNGIAGIVVKYRLPVSKSIIQPHKAPLQDAQRAIRIVKNKASAWNIDPDKIGIMGFSAGGHLASTLGTHFDEKTYTPKDTIDTISAKPNFMALIYPVISFVGENTHSGSKTALLGQNPDEGLVKHYSNELQVKEDTPQTFLVHAGDDTAVPVGNSIAFYRALKDKNIAAEMHIFPKGGHGFGLATNNAELSEWKTLFINWLKSIDL